MESSSELLRTATNLRKASGDIGTERGSDAPRRCEPIDHVFDPAPVARARLVPSDGGDQPPGCAALNSTIHPFSVHS